MPQTKKIFPLRLDAEAHTTIKKGAEETNKSMHQYILDAAMSESGKEEAYQLLSKAYMFIKGGPAVELEEAIFNWLMNNK
jgi:uncharacterized protein (DUF1778 family)